ncbi:phosphopantetheine-binding protein [Spirillospora sp. NBC_01491]|uniref:phosphopantetheine-binding protein n=1 Tax=Spirillospora sp. NBC_01491 TaxID=2976007 RepID=UPI002E3169D8|nr:phosphopantetheine-binding protein [Spirillospora sp. NBC_01491]
MDDLERSVVETVRKAWAARLGTGDFGTDDNFFEFGGTSRMVAAVCADLAVALDREIPLVAFYENQNIRALAHFLVHGETAPQGPPERVRRAMVNQRQRALRAAARAGRTEG